MQFALCGVQESRRPIYYSAFILGCNSNFLLDIIYLGPSLPAAVLRQLGYWINPNSADQPRPCAPRPAQPSWDIIHKLGHTSHQTHLVAAEHNTNTCF